MSKIYNRRNLSSLPVPNSNNRTRNIYHASLVFHNRNDYYWGIDTKKVYVNVNCGREIDGVTVDNLDSIAAPIILFVTMTSELYFKPSNVIHRKKGYIYNIKKIMQSRFMYDTKYSRYLFKWK